MIYDLSPRTNGTNEHHVFLFLEHSGRAVAQLPKVVVAPAHHPASGGQRTGVTITRCNGHHPARQPNDRHRRATVAETPTLDPAAARQSTGVIATRCQNRDALQR